MVSSNGVTMIVFRYEPTTSRILGAPSPTPEPEVEQIRFGGHSTGTEAMKPLGQQLETGQASVVFLVADAIREHEGLETVVPVLWNIGRRDRAPRALLRDLRLISD